MRLFTFCLLTATLLSGAAIAQTNRDVIDRMDRLERDVMSMQRQSARGLSPAAGGEGDVGGAAGLEVRLSNMEQELRNLRGKVEENDFQVRRMTENFEKFQRDVEMRFQDVNKAVESAAQAQTHAPATEQEAPPAKPTKESVKENAKAAVDSEKSDSKTDTGKEDNFENPRDHYNYAFRLLNQTRYDEASSSFKEFTQKYGKDPLIGNAYYWLGETYYIRRDYVNAADNFRQGFEVLPGGPKAADNLLKLSMSLSAMKKNKEACVVLDQILVKFKENSTSVAQKADQERARIGCQ